MLIKNQLTPAELAAAKRNRAAGEASLACEGMYLTAEESRLFDSFEHNKLSHDECRKQLIAFNREQRQAKAHAAK